MSLYKPGKFLNAFWDLKPITGFDGGQLERKIERLGVQFNESEIIRGFASCLLDVR